MKTKYRPMLAWVVGQLHKQTNKPNKDQTLKSTIYKRTRKSRVSIETPK